MARPTELIHNVIAPISDQGNALLSKSMVYLGVSGSSIGVASGVASVTDSVSTEWLTLAEWGSVCGIVGGLTLAIKSGADIYFARKKDKREQEQHNKDLGGE